MPHVKPEETSKDLSFSEFVELHRHQLVYSRVPEKYWATTFAKLKDEVYDAGESFQIVQVQYESDDGSASVGYKVRVMREEGLDITDPSHVYLIDHAWTYRLQDARTQLTLAPGLLERMANLMDVPVHPGDQPAAIEGVLTEMWRYNQTYNFGNFHLGTEEALPVWYIMDEFGSRIRHSDDPSFRTVPFYYTPSQLAFTLLWPLQDLEQGDEVTRDYVEMVRGVDKRAARLLPWEPADLTHIPYTQEEQGEEYFLEYKTEETMPNPDAEPPILPKDRSIKAFFDSKLFADHLTDPRFEPVESSAEADIWWLSRSFKDFRALSDETPNTFVNQFPNESLVTVKDLLAIVSRRAKPGADMGPRWLPTTFSLQTELTKFVSFFQSREEQGLDNHWICKPWNLARGLDMHITNNLNHIVRLPDTGPKVACKYVEDPVLFHREGIGLVKFDVRYMVLMASSQPLKLYVYKIFWLRFANKPFSLDHFDDYEKHFTVMNYKDESNLKQVHYDEFIPLFESQYPDYRWSEVESDICEMIRELFGAAVYKPYPAGIPASPQSRAIYAIDLLLKWDSNNAGEKSIQPVICEVNFGPDCERAFKYHPHFINDMLSALFLEDTTDRPVIPL